jgi:hypothetical protein
MPACRVLSRQKIDFPFMSRFEAKQSSGEFFLAGYWEVTSHCFGCANVNNVCKCTTGKERSWFQVAADIIKQARVGGILKLNFVCFGRSSVDGSSLISIVEVKLETRLRLAAERG